MKNFLLLLTLVTATMSCQQKQAEVQPGGFPFFMPEEKPDRPLSAALARNYDAYLSIRPEQNELGGVSNVMLSFDVKLPKEPKNG